MISDVLVLEKSIVGYEFEFFSDLNVSDVQKSLSRHLDKKIRIESEAHSDFVPTENTYKLEPDSSGGSGLIELVTGPMPYKEAKIILKKVLQWIKDNGSTNDRSSIHVNLAFDSSLGPGYNITNLDIGKFVLDFDEDYIYNLWPGRKESVYAKSIKFAIPNGGMTQDNPHASLWRKYKFVNDKYYGVNFTKIPKNYIEFRYLGGKDYESKFKEILDSMNFFILSLFKVLKNPKYSKNNIKELNSILDKHKEAIDAYKSYEKFKTNYPNLKLTVDLSNNEEIIKTFYSQIRDIIFKLITESKIDKCLINYDSDISRLQVKDAKINMAFLIKGIDIIDSKINESNIECCNLFNCNVTNSIIQDTNLFGECEIKSSKIHTTYVSRNVSVIDSYIIGQNGIFAGNMKNGIFRSGRATPLAKFDGTEIIEIEKIK